MGRRKLEIKRIEDKGARQVTFSKRRHGLLKKAKELSILWDVDVGVIIFSSRGKLHHYSSNNSLTEILQRYQSRAEVEPSPSVGVCETEVQHSKYGRGELLQIVERELGEPCIDQFSVTDLVHLEKQLEAALIQTRSTKTQVLIDNISSLHEKENMLSEAPGGTGHPITIICNYFPANKKRLGYVFVIKELVGLDLAGRGM